MTMHATDTTAATRAQAHRGAHERLIGAFLHQVRRDPGLPGNAYKVASVIAEHVNRRTRLAWPSQTTIGDLTALAETTVKKMIGLLRRRGHIHVKQGGGRGHSTHYQIIIVEAEKGRDRTPFVAAERGRVRAQKGVAFEQEKGRDRAPDLLIDPLSVDAYASTHSEEGEREIELALDDSTPMVGDAGALEGAAPHHHKQDHPAGERQKEPYAQLRAAWPRPWLDDEAADRRAFDMACWEVPPDVIIEAARDWVAAADAPRYLPSLAKWLAGHAWDKPPPHRRARRSTGGHCYGRKPNLAALMLEAGRAS